MFTILAVVLATAFMLSPLFVELYYAGQRNKEFEAWRTEFQNRK